MKIIGRNLEDGILMEMTIQEYIGIKTAAINLREVPDFSVLDDPALKEAVPAPAAPTPEASPAARTKKPRAKKEKGDKEVRLCAFCEKPLPRGTFALQKTHKGECNKKYQKKCANERYRAKHGQGKSGPTETLNPADPTLSESERMAARLAIIKRAAASHSDN